MIAVVTGASGFIGRNLVGRLVSDGHEVRCLTRRKGGAVATGVSVTPVDFDNAKSLQSSGALDGADVVFHLGAATRARSEAAFEAANVRPTGNLIEALLACGSRARFVFVSSQAAAGPASSLAEPVVEDDPPHPVEAYGRSKLAAERVVSAFSDRLPVTIIRPSSVFGRWDRDFLRLFRMAARGVVLYPGNEQHWLSIAHVDDVVDGLLAAAVSPNAEGSTYFLTSQNPVQWRMLGDGIATALGRGVSHVNIPGGLVRAAAYLGDAAALVMHDTPLLNSEKVTLARYPFWVCSSERARRELGWKPFRSLPDALRDTYLWYVQSGWLQPQSKSASAA